MLKRVIVGSAIAAASWYAFYRVMRWRETSGRDPDEAELPLPGDELTPDADSVDTRGIAIAAPPEAVWPWLVQMGYGRGGWYSYDRLDMKGRSADEIRAEWQSLAVEDVVPTDPGGGFVVRRLEPGAALVLYTDGELMAAQRGARTAADAIPGAASGLAASGRFLDAAVAPEFAASWAFVLRPMPGGGTRLVERVRFATGPQTAASRVLGPLLGFGVFVMMERQLRGIRERAERVPGGAAAAVAVDVPAPTSRSSRGRFDVPATQPRLPSMASGTGPTTLTVLLAMALLVAACSGLPSIVPTPGSQPVPAPPSFGPTDLALARLDPGAVMKRVRGGERCRPTLPHGSHGGEEWHMVAGFTCQRFGNDRDVWFEFADAWEAELKALGSVGDSGGAAGGPEDPLVEDWSIRGETRVGMSHVIGVNGPGTLQVLVSLDLVTP